MAIRFACGSCGQSVIAPDELTGRKARCPHCQAVQVVPSAAPKQAPARILGSAPVAATPKSHTNLLVAGIAGVGVLTAVIAVIFFLTRGRPAPVEPSGSSGRVSTPALPGDATTPAPITQGPAATHAATPTPAAVPPSTAPGPATQIASPATPQPSGPSGPIPVAPYAPGIVSPGGLNNPAAYLEVVLNAKEISAMRISKANLAQVKASLDAYAQMNDEKFPATVKELIDSGAVSALPASPGDKNKTFIYVSGQGPKSPKTNILMYDPHPYGRTRIVALQVDGTIDQFNIEDIKKALTAQGAKPEEMPK